MCPDLPACWSCGSTVIRVPDPLREFPAPYLLETYESPTFAEAEAVRIFNTEAAEQLRILDLGLESIKDTLRTLERHRADRQKALESYNAVLSPFRRLPTELLVEVFVYCLPENDAPTRRCAPLLLMGVCKRWRSVALSTPRLWCALRLQIREATNKVAGEWFARAGNLPLSLAVQYKFYTGTEPFFAVIAKHAARWEKLSITVNAQKGLAVSGPLLRLRSLVLETCNDRHYGLSPSAFHDAPSLRSFTYSGDVPEDQLDIPWGQLTDLTLNRRPAQGCVTALRLAHNLETCTLDCTQPRSGVTTQAPPVQHMRLKHLTISEMEGDRQALFRQTALTFPVLETFDYAVSVVPWREFHYFQMESGFQLRKLSLRHVVRVTVDEAVRCFESMPSLEHFELSLPQYVGGRKNNFTSPEVLSRLTRRHGTDANADGPQLLPLLRVLELHDLLFDDEETAPRLASMIRSRRPIHDGADIGDGTAYLERVVIDYADTHVQVAKEKSLEELVIRTFQALKDEGFDISVLTGTDRKRAPHTHRLV